MSSSWTCPPVFAGGNLFVKKFLRDLILLPGFFCLIFALTACGDSSNIIRSSNTGSASAPPPGTDQRPLEAGQLGRTIGPDGLPTLDAPKGVNVSVDTLFAEDIKDPIDRIRRLENAILEMRRDYDATLPAIKRLVSIEKDMQTLMAQLESLTNTDTGVEIAPAVPVTSENIIENTTVSAMPVTATDPAMTAAASQTNDPTPLVPAVPEDRAQQVSSGAVTPLTTSDLSDDSTPANAPAELSSDPAKTAVNKTSPPPAEKPPDAPQEKPVGKPAEKPKPPETSSQNGAFAVRLGEDGGKTRLVIDLGQSVTHRTDLDNDEKIMVIEINGAEWNGPATRTFTSPRIKSYTTQPLESGKGTRLIVTLKKPVKIALDSLLSPDTSTKNYRLVIDLKE